jgi:acetyl-CoA synthetase
MVFDYDSEHDIFGCLADVGWITGHSYVVYGPLCNGGTTVLFESSPIYPNPGRYWETVERLKINQLYLAPTSLRLLIKYGDEWVSKYSRSSLKCLGTGLAKHRPLFFSQIYKTTHNSKLIIYNIFSSW